jgi:hypothetical protein
MVIRTAAAEEGGGDESSESTGEAAQCRKRDNSLFIMLTVNLPL